MRLAARLVFVEGLPGAGKTTIGKWLADHHPGWRFLEEGPTFERPVHPLRVNSKLEHPMAVWQDLSAMEYPAFSLGLWRDFVASATGSVVCDGLLFHGNMTDLMLVDAPRELICDYVHAILDTVQALDPAVIYMRQPDVTGALRATCEHRGEGWQQYQVDWKMSSPYARRRGLAGFEGMVRLYEEYVAICDELFDGLTVPRLRVELDGDWTSVRRDILSFLA